MFLASANEQLIRVASGSGGSSRNTSGSGPGGGGGGCSLDEALSHVPPREGSAFATHTPPSAASPVVSPRISRRPALVRSSLSEPVKPQRQGQDPASAGAGSGSFISQPGSARSGGCSSMERQNSGVGADARALIQQVLDLSVFICGFTCVSSLPAF